MQRATIADVAATAGVSRAAVSKVLRNAHGVSPDMRTRVEHAVEQLGYRPRIAARAMRGSTNTIGIVVNHLANHFFAEVLEGVIEENSAEPYQLIVAPTAPSRSDGHEAIESLYDREVDGIIAVAPLVDLEWLERMSSRVPIVVIGRHDEAGGYDTVVGDDAAGTEAAVHHLIDTGRTSIAHVTHADSHARSDAGTPHAIRRDTYARVMRESGLAAHTRLIWARFEEQPAYEATLRDIAENGVPDAVFAGNDDAALGVLRALHDIGATARDVALVGYDNTRIAANPAVSLTSVDQQGHAMGRTAFGLLRERIGGRREPARVTLPTALIIRRSSASSSQINQESQR
ncbi:LacI family DNA-binding transcriptional regulator [Microbacterium chocolatum]|uniref:LacI family DNA-binding transcriptional regulator n=1 Tax=Microbacterium aurantiacum TaxID=162393 RepID=UPI00338D7ED8